MKKKVYEVSMPTHFVSMDLLDIFQGYVLRNKDQMKFFSNLMIALRNLDTFRVSFS